MGRATGSDRVLWHIVALLVALAVLAERAAGRSLPVRWLVLAILSHGERAACAYLAEVTGFEWQWLEEPADLRCDWADAIHLAARLRMLAVVLVALLCDGGDYPGRGRRIDGGHRLTFCAVRPAVIPDGPAAGPYDTS